MVKPQTLSQNVNEILSILSNIIKNESSNPFIDYPILIGSRAMKWHIPSFREPNDWNLVATPSQSIFFINKVMLNTTFRNIKLVYYSDAGLKIIGECIEPYTNEKLINFDIELVSDKVDLRRMKVNETLDKKESDNNSDSEVEKNDDDDDIESDDDYDYDIESDDDYDYDIKSDDVKVNNIEFEMLDDNQPKMSALMILELCHNVEDKMLFPLSSILCIVAPLKILEALKSSHIYWPDNFHKNINDLHSLRTILGYDKKSLTQLLRDNSTELLLKTRIKETEIIRDIPGKHINLNKSNEDFLDREDDLFVQKRVPHDDLHKLVKYGDHPIYEGLKDDQSKAWIKKSLFQKLDYQTQLNCVREEAMVIALERYLIPMISKNQETSYNLGLIKICITLSKGWFRQFAIDNYPQLSNLDKDLISIAQDVIDKYPLQQKKPHELTLDLETKAIFEPIRHYTENLSFDDIKGRNLKFERSGIKITSPVNSDISITVVVTTMCKNDYIDSYTQGATWTASVVMLPSKYLETFASSIKSKIDDDDDDIETDEDDDDDKNFNDPLNLHPYYDHEYEQFSKLTSKHVYTLLVRALNSCESWDAGDDVWNGVNVQAKSADYFANKLEIPGFTGDLLFKYVLDCLRPTFKYNGETPLKRKIDELKADGVIPIEPKLHLWYYAWNNTLKTGNWKFIN